MTVARTVRAAACQPRAAGRGATGPGLSAGSFYLLLAYLTAALAAGHTVRGSQVNANGALRAVSATPLGLVALAGSGGRLRGVRPDPAGRCLRRRSTGRFRRLTTAGQAFFYLVMAATTAVFLLGRHATGSAQQQDSTTAALLQHPVGRAALLGVGVGVVVVCGWQTWIALRGGFSDSLATGDAALPCAGPSPGSARSASSRRAAVAAPIGVPDGPRGGAVAGGRRPRTWTSSRGAQPLGVRPRPRVGDRRRLPRLRRLQPAGGRGTGPSTPGTEALGWPSTTPRPDDGKGTSRAPGGQARRRLGSGHDSSDHDLPADPVRPRRRLRLQDPAGRAGGDLAGLAPWTSARTCSSGSRRRRRGGRPDRRRTARRQHGRLLHPGGRRRLRLRPDRRRQRPVRRLRHGRRARWWRSTCVGWPRDVLPLRAAARGAARRHGRRARRPAATSPAGTASTTPSPSTAWRSPASPTRTGCCATTPPAPGCRSA